MTHWLGVAISLAYTIGLHRADNYDTISPRPFSDTLRRMWKCLWWNIMYRETWTAFGFGRPMRVDSEDCDIAMPTVQDVLGDASEALPAESQDLLPSNAAQLPKLWINLLELSQQLEHILKSYYRPRSNPPAPAQLQHDESLILSCRDRLQHYEAQDHSYSNINMLHLKSYYR